MVSIKDVAKEAGVAISTVSKVIKSYPGVSEDTRKKVQEAITKLGYVPNAAAAALSSKGASRIALIVGINKQTAAAHEIDIQYLSGALAKAQEMGFEVITVFREMLVGKKPDEVVRYFESQNVGGIIIYCLSKNDKLMHSLINQEKFKKVLVDAPLYKDDTSAVWIDQEKAQYEVAKKTFNGHKINKILYLSGSMDGYVTEERIKGIKRLAEEKKVGLTVKEGNFSEKRAREITLKDGKKYDLIVCGSDMMAIGAMRALIELDIFRPVSGFDGISLMGYAGKQMNTVKQDFYQLSEEAISEMARLLSGEKGRRVIVPHKLVRLTYEDVLT